MKMIDEPPGRNVSLDEEGLTIYLKVNYKVLLLVIVIADLIHTSLSEFVARHLTLSNASQAFSRGLNMLMSIF
jgi:hypothetical protein